MIQPYLREKLNRRIAARLQRPLTKRTLYRLSALSDDTIQRISDAVSVSGASQVRFLVRLINGGFDERFLADAITYRCLIDEREYLVEWFIAALCTYRSYPWYPPSTDASTVPRISLHLDATRQVSDEVLKYWYENSITADGDSDQILAHIGTSTRNRQQWVLAEERLVQHLFENPEDADACREIIASRGTISYGLLLAIRDHSPAALSSGTL